MSYVFTDGEIGTKAKLDTLVPPISTQSGVVRVTPVANTPTAVQVTFATPFPVAPRVAAAAYTTAIGDTVKGVSVTGVTETGFTAWVYRTNTTNLTVCWQAWGASSGAFVTGSFAFEALLNGAAGAAMACQSGQVTVSPPSGGGNDYVAVTFPTPFKATPTVVACPGTTVPGTVLGAAVSNVTLTGCRVWASRTNSTNTTVFWIALGRT